MHDQLVLLSLMVPDCSLILSFRDVSLSFRKLTAVGNLSKIALSGIKLLFVVDGVTYRRVFLKNHALTS